MHDKKPSNCNSTYKYPTGNWRLYSTPTDWLPSIAKAMPQRLSGRCSPLILPSFQSVLPSARFSSGYLPRIGQPLTNQCARQTGLGLLWSPGFSILSLFAACLARRREVLRPPPPLRRCALLLLTFLPDSPACPRWSWRMRLRSGVFASFCLLVQALGVGLFLRGFFPVPVRSLLPSGTFSQVPAEPPRTGTAASLPRSCFPGISPGKARCAGSPRGDPFKVWGGEKKSFLASLHGISPLQPVKQGRGEGEWDAPTHLNFSLWVFSNSERRRPAFLQGVLRYLHLQGSNLCLLSNSSCRLLGLLAMFVGLRAAQPWLLCCSERKRHQKNCLPGRWNEQLDKGGFCQNKKLGGLFAWQECLPSFLGQRDG